MLLVSAARSAVAWKRGAVAAAETYSAAVAATTSLQIGSVLPLVLGWDYPGPGAAQSLRHPRDESRTTFRNNEHAKETCPVTLGFAVASWHLSLCVRLQ